MKSRRRRRGGKELASGRDLAALRAKLGEAAQLSFAAADPAFERKGLRAMGLRRPAGDADLHARRPAAHRLSALVDEATRVSLALLDTADAAETRDARGRRAPASTSRSSDALARYDKGRNGIRAGRAASSRRRSHRPAAGRRAGRGADRAPIWPTIRCRGRSGRSRNRSSARGRGCRPSWPGAFRLLSTIADRISGADPADRGRAAAHGAAGRRGARRSAMRSSTRASSPARPGRSSTPAALPEGAGPAAGQVSPSGPNGTPGTPSRWRNVAALPRAGRAATARLGKREPRLEEFRWLLEELRVSLFAQELKTPFPVSFKRVEKAWTDLVALIAVDSACAAMAQRVGGCATVSSRYSRLRASNAMT